MENRNVHTSGPVHAKNQFRYINWMKTQNSKIQDPILYNLFGGKCYKMGSCQTWANNDLVSLFVKTRQFGNYSCMNL